MLVNQVLLKYQQLIKKRLMWAGKGHREYLIIFMMLRIDEGKIKVQILQILQMKSQYYKYYQNLQNYVILDFDFWIFY